MTFFFFKKTYGDFKMRIEVPTAVSRILAAPDRKTEAASVLPEFVAMWKDRKKANNTVLIYKGLL
jgi:hypothetical protein